MPSAGLAGEHGSTFKQWEGAEWKEYNLGLVLKDKVGDTYRVYAYNSSLDLRCSSHALSLFLQLL